MKRKKVETNLFFTDDSIGFYLHRSHPLSERFDHVELEKGILENGEIVDPELLLSKLRAIFKANQIHPKTIRLVLNDQNVLLRKLDIPNENLLKMGIDSYLSTEMGKSLHFPFVKTALSYHVIETNPSTTSILLIASNESTLHDYLDVFDRLRVKEVRFDMPALALYNYYLTQSTDKFKDLMLITLYEFYFTIKIFEDGIPVFNLTEEFEGTTDLYMDQIENYVERVANYYRFNLHKGTKRVANLLFVNFSGLYDAHAFESALSAKPGLREYRIFHLPITSESGVLSRSCQMAYAAGIAKSSSFKAMRTLAFQLERPDRSRRIAHYFFTLAFAIFSIVSLIYIPLHTTNEDLLIQQNLIDNLELQRLVLLDEAEGLPTFTQKEKDYSDAYDSLIEEEFSVTSHLLDLFARIPEELELVSYRTDAAQHTIVLVLMIGSVADLNDYLLDIYETYGLSEAVPAEGRWMIAAPVQTSLSAFVIEVTVRYA